MDTPPNPSVLSQFWGYLWVFFLSAWGGVISYRSKVKAGKARPWNFSELIGEISTSAFVGVLTFLIFHAWGMNDYLTAAFVGISGHMGTRALFRLERYFEERFFPQPCEKENHEP